MNIVVFENTAPSTRLVYVPYRVSVRLTKPKFVIFATKLHTDTYKLGLKIRFSAELLGARHKIYVFPPLHPWKKWN